MTDYYNVRGPDGRFVSKPGSSPKRRRKKKAVTKPKKPSDQTDQITYVSLVVDASGSMASLRGPASDAFNSQLDSIKGEAYKNKQATAVSVYRFGSYVECICERQHPEGVKRFSGSEIGTLGMTALRDAIATAMRDMRSYPQAENTANLIIVITDGFENESTISKALLTQQIADAQKTGEWSFVVTCPASSVQAVQALGIPGGNIQSWDGTAVELKTKSAAVNAGISGYYATRSTGKKSTASFFADVGGIGERDLKDVTSQFRTWVVPSEADIAEVADKKFGGYILGHGFYELTKSERVQPHKKLLLRHIKSKRIFEGPIRAFLKADPNEDIRLKPGNQGDYRVYVQSTSMNRKLVRGSTLIYKR